MHDNDTLIRLLNGLALVNKALEQFNYIVNNNEDARYRGISTQLYTTKQDIEDAMREGWVETQIPNANAPNLPNGTSNVNGNTGTSTAGSSTPNNGSNVTPTVVPPTQPVTPTPNPSINPNAGTIPNGVQNASDFFDNLLKGATANNKDLADALNQITQGGNNNTPSQSFPF